jgi:serine/threonine protein kinase
MAPELLQIKLKQYDPSAVDVWALGVLLFRILIGTYPFSGEIFLKN